MSFLSRAANLDFIQTNRTIIWPLTSSFAILSFLNNPHLIGVPVSHISKNIFKKETWVWRGVLSWRERQLLQSSSICSHATIEVFKRISGNLWGLFSERENWQALNGIDPMQKRVDEMCGGIHPDTMTQGTPLGAAPKHSLNKEQQGLESYREKGMGDWRYQLWLFYVFLL